MKGVAILGSTGSIGVNGLDVASHLGLRVTGLAAGANRKVFRQQIDNGPITVTSSARDIAEVILAAPLPTPVRVLIPAHRLATAGTLPPPYSATSRVAAPSSIAATVPSCS